MNSPTRPALSVPFVLSWLLILGLSGAGVTLAAPIPFGAQQIVSTSEGFGVDVIAGDLDGDGDLDLVGEGGTNTGSGVSVYENLDGAGTFSSAQAIDPGQLENRSSIALADMDQDGDLDLLTGNFIVSVWYPNDGQGNFAARTVIRNGFGFTRFSAGDLDGDGDLDVIGVTGYGGNALAWFTNNGGGSFNAATENFIDSLPNGNGEGDAIPADVDGDGDLDLVVLQSTDGDQVAWYQNTDGAGTFSAKLTISMIPTELGGVAVSDVDRDGDLDVVSVEYGGHTVRWHENTDGDGSAWTDHTIASANTTSFFVNVADMDLDGDDDVLLASRVSNEALWIENTAGDGSSWTTRGVTGNVSWPLATIAADVDGDGDPDVVTASLFDNKFAWNENRTIHRNAEFPVPSTIGTSNGARSVFAVDVDGDGDVDALSGAQGGEIAWFDNNGANPPVWTKRTISAVAGQAFSVFAADVDGDGDVDALSASSTPDNTIAWYENNGATPPVWTQRTITTSALNAFSVFAADLDGDGDLDVLSTWGTHVDWYENDGASPPAWTTRTITTSASNAPSVFAADVDGDGDLDALSASLSSNTIGWYENDGASPPAWTTRTISTSAAGAWSVFAADVDGDGDVDALSASFNDDTIAWYENDGASPPVWTARTISTDAVNATSVFATDVDGDGDVDALSASSNDNKIAWYENNGASPPVWTARTISTDAVNAASVFATDVDGDGDVDVLSAESFLSKIAWYANLGGQFGFSGWDISNADAFDGEMTPLLAVTVRVHGRSGDSVGRLATLDVDFEVPTGFLDPMSSAEANALVDELRIYRDDGSGGFDENQDILVTSVSTLALTNGTATVTLPAGDPNTRVAAPATFFVVALMTPNASNDTVDVIYVTHPGAAGSSMVDASAGIPLAREASDDVYTDFITVRPRFLVDSFDDIPDATPGNGVCGGGPTACTLRAAIQEANALPGPNRIVLVAGTFLLDEPGIDEDAALTGDLDVTDTTGRLTLVGQGADRTIIDGGDLDRVFHVLSSVPVTLEDLTVTGGSAQTTMGKDPLSGAGLLAEGSNSITIRRCTFRDNTAASSGGAVFTGVGGVATVETSTFHDNVGDFGGTAIDSRGQMSLVNCTVSGNAGAQATNVAVSSTGAMNLLGCTVTGNQGGLRATGSSITLGNSIVAGNSSAGLSGDDINTGTFLTAGHNVIGESASAAFVDGVAGDQVGDLGRPLLPHLQPLGAYGGSTLTHPLSASSPAVDAGECSTLDEDQRGVARPIDVAGVPNVSDACDSGSYELEAGATLARIEVPVRWCGLRGAPSIEDPSLLGASNVNDLLRRRHEVMTDNIYEPQSGIVFRSAANFIVEDFPVLEDRDCLEGPPGTFVCEHGQRGDVYIDPAAAIFDEFEDLIAACREAWQAQDPEIQGITAVQIRRFVDEGGAPLEILGIGGRAQEGDAREQAAAGRAAVVDHFYRQDVPGNPSPPNPSDTIDRLLGHEMGHALSLRHGDGLDNDGNLVIDDDDERVVGLPRFDGDNLMQYRAGKTLSVAQVAQARAHLMTTVPDVLVQPLADSLTNDAPIDPANARVLEFGFDGVLDLANARVLEFRNANVLEFETESVLDFANARVLEFRNANVLEFANARVLEFGMTYDGELPTASTTLHATTAALPWPPALRPPTRYYFYLDVDRDDATGAYPADEPNPSDPGHNFPGSNNFTNDPDVAEEAGVDLIAQVELEADCPADECTSTAVVTVFDYNDGTGQYEQVLASPTPAITAVGVGLYVDNGGAPVDLESAPSGITVQPVIPNSLLFAAGWGFTTPPGGGAPVPDRVRMEVVTTIECAGEILNDDPASGTRDCQCTSCALCPDYPGCTGTVGTPKILAGTTILTDYKAGELAFQPPVLPTCVVIPALAAESQAVTVYVRDLPTDVDGTVVVERGESVIGTTPTGAIDAAGAVDVAVTLPEGALGDVTLRAGIAGYAPRAQCVVKVAPSLPCPDNDGDGACDDADGDDDDDGVSDGADSASLNPLVCRDLDADLCDDCWSGADVPATDGPDYDLDGLCDRGDPDDDNDGFLDVDDGAPRNANACGDADADTCDDCVIAASPDPANDGADADADGACDLGDNCPALATSELGDLDGDGFGDVCDCAPADPVNGLPAEVDDSLRLAQTGSMTVLSWSDGGSAAPFRVYRGWLRPGDSWEYNHYCAGEGVPGTSWAEPLSRNPFTLFYYLVAREGCGESIPGRDSANDPIPQADPCPSTGMDADADGTEQAIDNCPGVSNMGQADVDADGHGDVCDNCPGALNPYQDDLDGDDLGDACDPDVDGDTILDDGSASGTAGDARCTNGETMACDDNCPRVVNPTQVDEDLDAVGDPCDNCPAVSNPGQQDTDFNGIGDACEMG